MPRETYLVARRRILTHLVLQGWSAKPTLKVPQACLDGEILYFHPQAVHLNGHSLFVDIRTLSNAEFVAAVDRAIEVRHQFEREIVARRNERTDNGPKCEPT